MLPIVSRVLDYVKGDDDASNNSLRLVAHRILDALPPVHRPIGLFTYSFTREDAIFLYNVLLQHTSPLAQSLADCFRESVNGRGEWLLEPLPSHIVTETIDYAIYDAPTDQEAVDVLLNTRGTPNEPDPVLVSLTVAPFQQKAGI